jgi:hypothetical protein
MRIHEALLTDVHVHVGLLVSIENPPLPPAAGKLLGWITIAYTQGVGVGPGVGTGVATGVDVGVGVG